MRESKRKALEAAGWVSGDGEDFLDLNAADRAIVAFRVAIGRRVREIRAERRLTQAAVAKLLGSTQPFVSGLENAGVGLSLEAMIGALLALGGTIREVVPAFSSVTVAHAPEGVQGLTMAAQEIELPSGRRTQKAGRRPAKKRRVPSS